VQSLVTSFIDDPLGTIDTLNKLTTSIVNDGNYIVINFTQHHEPHHLHLPALYFVSISKNITTATMKNIKQNQKHQFKTTAS